MNESIAPQPASLWRRAVGRGIDAFVTAVLVAVTTIACGVPVGLIAIAIGSGPQVAGSSAPSGADLAAGLMFVAVVVVAVVVAVRYEVVRTARTGQTSGKKAMGIAVVGVGGHRRRFWARWALPHGFGLVAAYGGAGAGGSTLGPIGLLIGVGAGLVGWMLVYASALWGTDRRGWHDKAAGTMVVRATDEVLERLAAHEPSPRELSRSGSGAGEQPVRASLGWSGRLPPPS